MLFLLLLTELVDVSSGGWEVNRYFQMGSVLLHKYQEFHSHCVIVINKIIYSGFTLNPISSG